MPCRSVTLKSGTVPCEVSPLDLESLFNQVAGRIARRLDLHHNTAIMLGWTFTSSQRQVLAYMFWQIFHVRSQYNRRARAEGLLTLETLGQ
jgi:hypothetical protein